VFSVGNLRVRYNFCASYIKSLFPPLCCGFLLKIYLCSTRELYRGADKSLTRPTSRGILFDDDNISFDASLGLCIYIVLKFLHL
jgi:hypothetical protein